MLKIIEEKMKASGRTFIKCEFDSPDDYYHMLDVMTKFTRDNLSISGTSRQNHFEIVVNEDSDMDDTTKPTTVGLRKKKKKVEETKEEET